MGLFDFLKDANSEKKAAGKVFHFLGGSGGSTVRDQLKAQAKAQPNNQAVQRAAAKPQQTTTPVDSAINLGVSSARAIPRAGATIGKSVADETNKALGLPQVPAFDPSSNPLTRAVLGSEPIQSAQERQKGVEKVVQGSRFHAAATPLSFLGVAGSIGADAVPVGGPAKTAAEKGIADLAKAKTVEDVQKIMKGTSPDIVNRIAPAITQTKDPNVIRNLLHKELNPKPATMPPEPQVPVSGEVIPPSTGQGSVDKPNEAINKHLQTINNASSTTTELKDAISGLKQTHEVRDTQKLSDKAKSAIDKDYTGSLTKVLSAENPGDHEVAMGEHLIVKAQQEGKTAEAVNIAETLDKNLREHGRAIQAASIINRLSPEGQLLRASRIIRKARESNPQNAAKEQKTAKEIQQAVADSAPTVDRSSVHQIIKDISKDQQKLGPGGLKGSSQTVDSTGQALAKNVDRAATPQIKKKADALVAELTKKVKQEYLPLPNQVQKSPIDTLREVFGRNAEAQDAYPLAQDILRKKYANSPSMQEALDKFFGSKLDLPAASSTINRSISEQLNKNGERIADIIHKSLQGQQSSVESTVNDLVKEGFDEESAAKLAKEVSKRLGQQVSDAKRKTLERLAKSAKEKNQPTFLDKIHKMSNLGALDDHDYLQLARAKLNLPHLKDETASKIHELSQKMQDLPEGHEKYAAYRELQHVIARDIPTSKTQLAKEFLGLPRTILSSGDFSFGGRQGLVHATSHPIGFIKAWPKQFQYFKQAFGGKDSEAYDAMMADVKNNEFYPALEKHGRLLDPTGHDVNSRNEQFISSDLAEKIPGLGRLVRGSNYAFTGLHNTLYANQFYGMLEHLKYAGIKPTEHELSQIAEVVGTSLGRGGKGGGFTEKHAGFLSTGLFAPRLMASRLNVMNPAYYIRLKGPARKEALRGLLGLSAFATAVLGTAKLAGAKVSTDPRNADFGKIRVGDTRFDVLGGHTQYIRLGAQLITGQKVNSTTGAQTEAGKGLAGSRLDIASNFIQGKENPSVSLVTDLLKGKDISGNSIYNPKGVGKEVVQRFIPLLAQDIADLQTHQHSAGPGAAIPAVLGTGIQTYGLEDLPLAGKQKVHVQSLENKGAPKDQIEATKSLLQTLKTAPSKTDAKDSIIKAMQAGDTGKVVKLAQEFNKKYDATSDDWFKKNNKYYKKDEYLIKEYRKGWITESTLNSWDSALHKEPTP